MPRAYADMEPDQTVHAVQHPGLEHGPGAAAAFFRRLEDEAHAALQIFADMREYGGKAKAESGMGVVAAGVHAVWMA